MRVITGKYKGRHFEIPRTFKARPTTDFAKENLFNVLQGYMDWEGVRALDLFAGTGSITLEMLSRGCEQVVSVENDPQHHAFIVQVMRYLKETQCIPLRTDALRYITRCRDSYDFIFADPPYALKELGQLPELVLNGSLLKDGGLFVLEHGKNYDFSQHPRFVEHRAYGSVNFSLFR